MVIMRCYAPITLPNPAATCLEDRNITVACGKCYACLSNRRRAWLFRLQCECMRSKAFFVTLTYDDSQCDGFLHKEHVRLFVDKLREVQHFRYYFIGELGTHTFRPHYHAILFFSNPDLISYKIADVINEIWNRGFTCVSPASYRRLNYVLHYHTRPKEPVKGIKTFSMRSNHIGDNFIYNIDGSVKSDVLSYLQTAKFPVIQDFEGNYYVIPRYYRKKLQEEGFLKVNVRQQDYPTFFDRYISSLGYKPYQLSEHYKAQLHSDIMLHSNNRLNNYNSQDKFI